MMKNDRQSHAGLKSLNVLFFSSHMEPNKTSSKIVLFGPNGAGKSFIIRKIIENGIEIDDIRIEKPKAFVHITESRVRQVNVRIFDKDEFDITDFAIVDPTVARRLYMEAYYDRVYDEDRGWLQIRELSYGQRRRLAIDAALEKSGIDLIAVESFESGLHADYIAQLIKEIAESNASVVIESHSPLTLKLAMRYGLHAYYVEDGHLRRIERLDDYQLFSRELSAYNAIVV